MKNYVLAVLCVIATIAVLFYGVALASECKTYWIDNKYIRCCCSEYTSHCWCN